MASRHLPPGLVHDAATRVLAPYREYEAFRNGRVTRDEFASFLDTIAPELVRTGFPADDVQFAKRYPASEEAFVRDAMDRLVANRIIPHARYDVRAYERAAARARQLYDHGPFSTYIYPEEARLLFAVADVLGPRRIVVLGSYYGYWAYWAAAAVGRHGGTVALVDPDARAQAVARASFARLGMSAIVDIVEETGEHYLARRDTPIDCVILDAELPRTDPDPGRRGKGIYGALLGAAACRVSDRATLICHNILFQDFVGSSFFAEVVDRNRRELSAFLGLVERHCESFVELASTEGVGVGRFRSAA